MLADDIVNDGTETADVPDMFADQVRIKIKCTNNIFYDINDADLMIIPESVDCNTTNVVGDPIGSGIYSSSNILTSDGRVPSDAQVIFTGANEILMTGDFQVDQGGYFEAQIYPCD